MAERNVIHIGDTTVHIFNVGMLRADLAEWFGVTRDSGPEEFREALAGYVAVPVQCVHIQHGETSVLVDACVYDLTPDSPYTIPGYSPPASLVEQLEAASITVAEVAHVVITHAHFDHFNGLTQMVDGETRLVFPNAQVYLGKADWESPALQDALGVSDSVESKTLGVLFERGRLTLVDGETALSSGLSIVPSPGETPGHQSVRVESRGQVLYCIGDLYHHAIELAEPTWAVTWADAQAIAASRKALNTSLNDEDAVLIATHIEHVLHP